ncbi:helix-turn-helix domain containing protein [Pediococcus inopinatus]|uniref:helix-turn-helix domain-containing protein n=1 Tax=Pediococcus inopinatus TaxID=114090 RepID=UPI002B25BBA3|nr:helix-turn-helix domain-containing protein [Pediococcus inopinatus]WPC20496.1 helix-turn-helix domain containing protein [Pediococcus inopinatus]
MVKFNFDFKVKVVTGYLGGLTVNSLAHKYRIGSSATVLNWIQRYEKFGLNGLKRNAMDLEYASQFKVNVLNWRKQNQASLPVTALHFNLSSPSTIWQWESRFKALGIVGLERKRGNAKNMVKHKNKSRKPIVQKDNYTAKEDLKQLQKENEMLKIENTYLKKLEALTRKKSVQKKSQK